MAFKKRFVPKKRKMVRRTKKVYKKRSIIKSSAYPFPNTITRKFKYCETIEVNPTTGGVTTFSFGANNLTKPNQSLTGHQPYGFDQLMLMYNHYEVLASSFKATIANSDYLVGTFMYTKLDSDGNINTSTPQLLMEQPGVKYVIGVPEQGKSMSVRNYFSQKKFWGGRKAGDSTLCGNAASAPSDQAFFMIGLGPILTTFDAPQASITIEIEYVARLFEPKELVSS